MRFSTESGMPSLSHSSATHCQSVSAMTGKMVSILSPSIDTELISPGRLQKGMARRQVWALGLSTQMGTSVTDWIWQIIHTSVSASTASSTDAHTSRKVAPASAWSFARSRMNASSFAAMAFATAGMGPFSFSPMIIICFPLFTRAGGAAPGGR